MRLTKVAVKLPLWVGNYTGAAVHFATAALHNSWQRRRYRHQQVGTAANQPLGFAVAAMAAGPFVDQLHSAETKVLPRPQVCGRCCASERREEFVLNYIQAGGGASRQQPGVDSTETLKVTHCDAILIVIKVVKVPIQQLQQKDKALKRALFNSCDTGSPNPAARKQTNN